MWPSFIPLRPRNTRGRQSGGTCRGTRWLLRYSTHGAYPFKNAFFRELCRNLVIKIVVDEADVISHHVHHRLVEEAGGPVQR